MLIGLLLALCGLIGVVNGLFGTKVLKSTVKNFSALILKGQSVNSGASNEEHDVRQFRRSDDTDNEFKRDRDSSGTAARGNRAGQSNQSKTVSSGLDKPGLHSDDDGRSVSSPAHLSYIPALTTVNRSVGQFQKPSHTAISDPNSPSGNKSPLLSHQAKSHFDLDPHFTPYDLGFDEVPFESLSDPWPETGGGYSKGRRAASGDVIYVFDCSAGNHSISTTLSKCFLDNMMSERHCSAKWAPYVVNMYSELLRHSVATDFLGARFGRPRKWLTLNGVVYQLTCPRTRAIRVRTSDCYSDSAYPIRIGNRSVFTTHSRFVNEKAHQIPCENLSNGEALHKQEAFQSLLLISSEIMTAFLLTEISQPLVLAKLFSFASVAHLILMEESVLHHTAPRAFVTLLSVAYRKYSPFFFLAYGAFKIVWGLILFVGGYALRLSILQSLSLICSPVKSSCKFREWETPWKGGGPRRRLSFTEEGRAG